jgi:oligoendopeptidase F
MAEEKERESIATFDTWDLSLLYATDQAWYEEKKKLEERALVIETFRGALRQSATQLFLCLSTHSDISKEYSRLWSYAFMKADEDTRVSQFLSMKQELSQSVSAFQTRSSYIDPEITEIPVETIERFLSEEPRLCVYKRYFAEIQRQKKHTLSEPEEKILAQVGPMARTPYSTFEILSYADLPYPEVTLHDGESVRLDQSTFSKYRSTPHRDDRVKVFESFFDALNLFKRTFAVGLYGSVQKDVFYARTRHFGSCLEAALNTYNIPIAVYHSLIESVHANIESFHRYLLLKKRVIGVDTFVYPDVYAPVGEDGERVYTLSEAKKMIKEACACLGETYSSVLCKALDERWIDFYPNKGKASGAYSNGGAYDVHPFILMNFNGKYDDVSTLAHELGHTMHSYFSNTKQPYPTSDYSIFVAEVASTVNEVLLMKKQLHSMRDMSMRQSYLMHFLDHFKGTVFRQTQFAEFELKIHEEVEASRALTDEKLTEIYKGIFEHYYGLKKGITAVDERYFSEWAFVPHFYYNFYVYQYATSFTAAVVIAEKIFNNEPGIVAQYIEFLSSGSSHDPIDLLTKIGVDMRSPEPFAAMLSVMNSCMDEVERSL